VRGHAASISLRVVLSVWRGLPKYWVTLLRSPSSAAGSASRRAARSRRPSWLHLAKRFSKDPDSFGKGRIEGVFAAGDRGARLRHRGAAADAALGIPGSGTAAILLAA